MTDTIVIDTTSKSSSTGGANIPVTNTSLNKYNFLNLLAYVVNASVTFGIGVDGKYRSILAPFGPSFIIWTVIFVWQAIWVLWQFLPSQRNSEGVERAWYYYPIMTFWQTVWTVSYLYDIMWLSLICMYFILITLVMTSMSLQKYSKTWKGYSLWQGPISINTGWIMAAAAVSTNSFAVAVEATAATQLILSSLSLVVLLGTAFTWLCSYPVDFAIPLVIVWALGGIYGELQNPSQIVLEEFTTRQINGVQSGVLAGLYLSSFGIIVKILYVLLKQRPDSMKKKIHEEEQKGSSVSVSASSSASSSASAAASAASSASASASASASSSQEEEEEEAV
jgi:benzodiazapine receptor